MYEHEKEEHTSTKNVLNNIQSDLAQKIKEIENMENTHKAEVQNLTEKVNIPEVTSFNPLMDNTETMYLFWLISLKKAYSLLLNAILSCK